MIGSIIAITLGSAGGFALGRGWSMERERQEAEARKRAEDALAAARAQAESAARRPPPSPMPSVQYRAPDQTAVIPLPQDAEDFAVLTDAVCACLHALQEDAAQGGEPVGHESLRDCVLEAIYPDFVWPPVPGDPPEATMMYLIADHEARKAIADPSRCPAPPPTSNTPLPGSDSGALTG